MNLILLISDTLRRDHLGCYGSSAIRTPNLDRLAEQSVVFDQAFCCSFPTLPCRAEILTGRFVFPSLNWGPLPSALPVLPEVLAAAGYTCVQITDNFHMLKAGYGYDRGFHSRIAIRGQLYDNYRPAPDPLPTEGKGVARARHEQYLRNTAGRRGEQDWFAPQVVTEAIGWLERHGRRAPFFLHVDIFDPHEPWDAPREYAALYSDAAAAEPCGYPHSSRVRRYQDGELERLRALYCAEITLVDCWIGRLLEMLQRLRLADDTVILFMSDHGILLGERGLVGKKGRMRRDIRGWPAYPEIARIPLMIRAPGIAPRRSDAFVHPGDLAPTAFELLGVARPLTMKASSLAPLLRGECHRLRDAAVSSWSLGGWSAGRPSVIRTEEWSLVYWRAGLAAELYHRPSDPQEVRNVIHEHPAVARELHSRYLAFLRRNDTPAQHYYPRCWLGGHATGELDAA